MKSVDGSIDVYKTETWKLEKGMLNSGVIHDVLQAVKRCVFEKWAAEIYAGLDGRVN